ncbi:MAG: PilX N-terminal domain-containing pilus assembly protein [Pseudomonadota bacterium]
MSLKLLSNNSVSALSQRGFSLVSAIFLLVILSALGVFMLSISTMQQTTSTQDMQGSHAYQAAKAGLEWGAYQILNPENTNPSTGGVARYDCAAPAVLPAYPFDGSLSRFAVSVSCSSADFVEGGNDIRVYQLTSTASFGIAGSTSYIERRLTASINTCRTKVNISPC